MSTDSPPKATHSISFDVGAVGSFVQPVYLRREMTFYAIEQSELESISSFNTLASAFFSATASLLFLGVGIWVESTFQEAMTPEAMLLRNFGAPVLWALALGCGCLGIWAKRRRSDQLSTIRTESKIIQTEG